MHYFRLVAICMILACFSHVNAATSNFENNKARMARMALEVSAIRETREIDKGLKPLISKTAVPNSNDTCSTAWVITVGQWTGDTTFTSADDDGASYCSGSRDVWFRFSPPTTGYWRFSQNGGIDAVISLHAGCPGTEANQLACDDGISVDIIEIYLQGNEEYYLRLAGYNGEVGSYALTVAEIPILGNSQIELATASNGNFTAGRQPNASSTANWLLYGHPTPWSGATTLQVDGVNYWNFYGESLGTQLSGPAIIDDSMVTVWRAGGVRLTQTITLVRGLSSQMEDSLELSYKLENVDSVNHSAGVRILLDTYLGSNDGAPFRVPGLGEVTTERALNFPNIPQYWTAFDNLQNPGKKAQGSLIGPNGAMPDRVVWGSWPEMSESLWDYSPDSNRSLTADSAVYIYYNPRQLAPGESITHTTHYGLSGFNIDLTVPLAVGLNCPDRLEVFANKYIPNPMLVTAYIENTLGGISSDALNTYAELVLPPNIESVAPAPRQNIGTLARNAAAQVSWFVWMRPNLNPDNQPLGDPTTVTIQLLVGTSNLGQKTVSRDISVPKVYNGDPTANWLNYR